MASLDPGLREIALRWLTTAKGMTADNAGAVLDAEHFHPRSAIGKEQDEAVTVAKFVLRDRAERTA